MRDYRDDIACQKVVRQTRRKVYHCNTTPARIVPILNIQLCQAHQEEMSRAIYEQLGEDYPED